MKFLRLTADRFFYGRETRECVEAMSVPELLELAGDPCAALPARIEEGFEKNELLLGRNVVLIRLGRGWYEAGLDAIIFWTARGSLLAFHRSIFNSIYEPFPKEASW